MDRNLRIELMMSYRRLQLQFKALIKSISEMHDCADIHLLLLSMLICHQEISLRQLAELAGVSESMASIAVDELVTRGWVDRIRSSEDRRRLILRLRTEGAEFLHKVMGEHSQFDEIISQVFDFTEPEAHFLIQLNERMLGNLRHEIELFQFTDGIKR
ncbi:MarR family transcriptional regulator [Alicyclobacillus sp.]|uniref:MarR family winged helix-turn-helix transcriptional regulator n=1 Tax=Alicyclobacillus sp. TaxID=61169 RepID=UPI0025BF8987|nr:MarR family transcriptional regulator [Alicyclobacillus sp.]MCL6517447.1 MarR family transcriptional regulator [Alicyclobacillus sp.]